MSDVTISELSTGTPSSTDVIPFSNGSVTSKTTVSSLLSLASGIPAGGIIMWSGSLASIPTGWALCDGQSGRPDLRSRFIVGAGQGTGLTNYAVAATGGVESVTLTIAQMPSHSHGGVPQRASTQTGASGGFPPVNFNNINTGSAGEDQPHENRPPYYALAFIIKL